MDGSGGQEVYGVMASMPELTQALINAAQSAAQAAQAAQAASSSGGVEGSNNGVLKKCLAKLIPRPGSFSPSDREQEVLQWRDWYWVSSST